MCNLLRKTAIASTTAVTTTITTTTILCTTITTTATKVTTTTTTTVPPERNLTPERTKNEPGVRSLGSLCVRSAFALGSL
jgi:hypothetical protein